MLWKVIVNKKGLPFEIFLLDKVNICFEQNFAGHNEICLLYQSNVHGATKDILRVPICAYFYLRTHDFEDAYVDKRIRFLSKKHYFIVNCETYPDNLTILGTT